MTTRNGVRRPSVRLLVFVTAYAVVGCFVSPSEPSPDSIAPSSVIRIVAAPTGAVVAGPQSSVTLAAFLPRGSTSRTVTFTTNAGSFIENGTKQITARATLDSADTTRLVAQTALRDTLAETAIVRATVGEFYDTVSVNFVKGP